MAAKDTTKKAAEADVHGTGEGGIVPELAEDQDAQAAKDAASDAGNLGTNDRWIEVLVLLKDTLGGDKPNFREKVDALIASLGGSDRTGEDAAKDD